MYHTALSRFSKARNEWFGFTLARRTAVVLPAISWRAPTRCPCEVSPAGMGIMGLWLSAALRILWVHYHSFRGLCSAPLATLSYSMSDADLGWIIPVSVIFGMLIAFCAVCHYFERAFRRI